MLLAGSGHKVLMVDRAKFPSDTMSTHILQPPAAARLKRWGLLDKTFATNCPPITKAVMSTAPGETVEFEVGESTGLDGLVAPRRTVFDKLLVDAAVEAGAELAEGVSVDSLTWDGDRVTGIEGHTSEGAFSAQARFIVGADGRHSVVAREVEAPIVKDYGPTSSGFYTYYRNLPMDNGLEGYLHDGVFTVVAPTNDDLTIVAVAVPPEQFDDFKGNIETHFLATLDRVGDIGDRCRAAERVERFVGASAVPNYLRKVQGPGWALIGDAACDKDPAPADGISDAFRAAEYLSDAIDAALTGTDETEAMARFEKRHTDKALPLLDAAVRTARFDLTPKERFDAFVEIRIQDIEESMEILAPATNGA
jgi:2-polyprenyl-6-methoxyphenol hydroxylase-like FAD-dependent oxidoreductase